MKCDKEQFASCHLDGGLSSREAAHIEVHLSECSSCNLFFHEAKAREKQVRDVLDAAFDLINIREKVMRKIFIGNIIPEAIPEKRYTLLSVFSLKWISFAGLVILLLLVFSQHRPRSLPPAPIRTYLARVQARGNQAMVSGFPVANAEFASFHYNRKLEFAGEIAFFHHDRSEPAFIWKGQGSFEVGPDILVWHSGDGEFTADSDAALTIKLTDRDLRLIEGTVSIEGDVQTNVKLELFHGKAELVGGDGSVSLVQNDQVFLKFTQDEVPEPEITPEVESSTPEPAPAQQVDDPVDPDDNTADLIPDEFSEAQSKESEDHPQPDSGDPAIFVSPFSGFPVTIEHSGESGQ